MQRLHTALVMLAHRDVASPLEPVTPLQRAVWAGRGLTRATRRWRDAAGLTTNVLAALRRLETLEDGVDSDTERLAFQRWLANNVCAIHGVEVEAVGWVDHLASNRPMVVIANHISYLDPVAILSRVPAFSIAKEEVASWPLVGKIAAQLGMLSYARGNAFSGARVLRQCEQRLRRGFSVMAFPEGTTSRGRTVEGFHRGVFHLARHCNVPILPIVVRYDHEHAPWVGDDMFLPHYMRFSLQPRTRVVLEVLDLVAPEAADTAQAVRTSLERRYRSSLARSRSHARAVLA